MSAPCYKCRAIKRVRMYLDPLTHQPIYLCRRDATRLGYRVVDLANVAFETKITLDKPPATSYNRI